MGYAAFFVSVLAACLLWSAACSAAAARVHRVWLCRMLLLIGWVTPIAALVPWVIATGMLAFAVRLETNWFGPVLTTFVATIVGCTWIGIAGTTSPVGLAPTGPRAATWPAVGLAALFVAAKAVSFGILLILENAVAAEVPYLRLEAASIVESNLPPKVADDENAAPLYLAAFREINSDASLETSESPIAKGPASDISAKATREVVQRHRATLDLLRRATDREVCRFSRDWHRPDMGMILPEIQSMRDAARLLAVSARIQAVEGHADEALRDVACIARMSRHAASEPILVSGLVGIALDTLALDTLVRVLPAVDARLVERIDLDELVGPPPAIVHGVFGEEAFGLAAFANLADSRSAGDTLALLIGLIPVDSPTDRQRPWLASPLLCLYRVFLLPSDLAAYRTLMQGWQRMAANPKPFVVQRRELEELGESLNKRRTGLLTQAILPALDGILTATASGEARHAVARSLVAATRQRIATGSLPARLDDIDTSWLPARPGDPFTGERMTERQLLRSAMRDEGLAIWSVGRNGVDDGGPPIADAESGRANDDVGFVLPQSPK